MLLWTTLYIIKCFLQLFLVQTTSRQKMVMHVIQYLEQLLNSKLSDSAFTNLENFLGIQQQNKKSEITFMACKI